MADNSTSPIKKPDLGGAQFASHSWLEPVIVVTIMIGSLVVNRRKNFQVFGRSRSTTRPLLDDVHDGHSPDPFLDEDVPASTTVTHPSKRRRLCGLSVETPNSSRFADHWHSRVLQKFPFLIEMFYWSLNLVAYSCTKLVAAQFAPHDDSITELAQAHGIAILDLEHRSVLQFFFPLHEADFQAFFLHGHLTAMTFLNRIYSLVHIPGTMLFLSWFYYAAPDHDAFAVARRTMTLGNFVAFAIFCFYPCMPPRLLPPSYHFHDTVRQDNAESVWVGGKNVNQLAAMPSLHFTYAFVVGCTFVYHSGVLPLLRGKKRTTSPVAVVAWVVLGVCYPLLVLSVIVATANHYWLDAVVATLTTTLAFFGNRVWLIFLPAEDVLAWVLRVEKPEPTTGAHAQSQRGRRRRRDQNKDFEFA